MDRQTGEATAADLLMKELGLLDNLLYRNRNQHGGAKYYRKLEASPGNMPRCDLEIL